MWYLQRAACSVQRHDESRGKIESELCSTQHSHGRRWFPEIRWIIGAKTVQKCRSCPSLARFQPPAKRGPTFQCTAAHKKRHSKSNFKIDKGKWTWSAAVLLGTGPGGCWITTCIPPRGPVHQTTVQSKSLPPKYWSIFKSFSSQSFVNYRPVSWKLWKLVYLNPYWFISSHHIADWFFGSSRYKYQYYYSWKSWTKTLGYLLVTRWLRCI